MMIETVFEYICPVLIVLWIVTVLARLAGVNASSGAAKKNMLLLLSLVAALYPVNGLSVSDYILSVTPNFSIGSIAIFMIIIFRRIFNKELLSHKTLKSFAVWNIIISLIVFIPALGFTGLDIYAAGYGSSLLFILMATTTIYLIYQKSPLSYIFISYIVAFNLKLLPSANFFDYITDGVLFFMSLGILIVRPLKTNNNHS